MDRGAVPLRSPAGLEYDPNRWVPARVVAARMETSTARTLVLEADLRPRLAGQHVDVRLTAEDGYTAQRAYSLGSPAGSGPLALTVERLADGEVSGYLVDGVGVGNLLEVRGPIGQWFVWRPDEVEPVQLIAGGSGVVPLLSIVRTHAESGSTAPMRLLTSTRTPDDDHAVAELDGLIRPALSVDRLHTRAPALHEDREPGRIRAVDLERRTIPAAQSPTVYVCGPTGFVETVTRGLTDLGHGPERIRAERFGPTG